MDSTRDLVPPYDEIQSIFWNCLSEAENTFGPRQPVLRYGMRVAHEKKYPETINYGTIVLALFTEGRSRIGYYYEAGHEAVHCLHAGNYSTYLEEAVATAFALHMVRLTFEQYGIDRCKVSSSYQQAMALAHQVDTDIIRLGRQLRERIGYDSLSKDVTPNVILELYPDAPHHAIDTLTSDFPRQQ